MSLGSEDVEIYDNYFKSGVKADPNYEVNINAWHGTAAKPACQRAKIYNNIIAGFSVEVFLGNGAKDVDIYNNSFSDNTNSIQLLWGDWSEATELGGGTGTYSVTIKNNIIFGGLKVNAINTKLDRNLITDYNLYYRNGGSAVVNWAGTNYSLPQYVANTTNGDNSFENDPLFVSADSDFHLQSTSLAIDSGTSSLASSVDYDGNTRSQGLGYDIGAYEFYSVISFLVPPGGFRIQ